MEGAGAAFSCKDSPCFNEVAVERIQAAFEILSPDSIIYSGRFRHHHLYHMTRIVAGSPQCVSSHTRRIILAIECRHRAALIGALVDLYLILQGQGKKLLTRLLEQAETALGQRQLKTLERALLGEDVERVLRLPLKYSVLADGRAGALYQAQPKAQYLQPKEKAA